MVGKYLSTDQGLSEFQVVELQQTPQHLGSSVKLLKSNDKENIIKKAMQEKMTHYIHRNNDKK